MSSPSAFESAGDTADSRTELLSAILNDIGASKFLQNIVDDHLDDHSIPTFGEMKPEVIASKYGLPQDLSSAFVEHCHVSASKVNLEAKCTSHPREQPRVFCWDCNKNVCILCAVDNRHCKAHRTEHLDVFNMRIHSLAFAANLHELQKFPRGPHFQSLTLPPRPDKTVLYSACRSPGTSTELVALLLDKGCNANQVNGPLGLCCYPQHAIVESLYDVVDSLQKEVTQINVNLAHTLLDVLSLLKFRGAIMDATNMNRMTAHQEFLKFVPTMSACHAVSELVPRFLAILSPTPMDASGQPHCLFHSEYMLEGSVSDHSYVLFGSLPAFACLCPECAPQFGCFRPILFLPQEASEWPLR
jgi:hypothetical protein